MAGPLGGLQGGSVKAWMTDLIDLQRPVPIEVLNSRGKWIAGFLLLEFRADGLVLVRSERSGSEQLLKQGDWRDPVEEAILRRQAEEASPPEPSVALADVGRPPTLRDQLEILRQLPANERAALLARWRQLP